MEWEECWRGGQRGTARKRDGGSLDGSKGRDKAASAGDGTQRTRAPVGLHRCMAQRGQPRRWGEDGTARTARSARSSVGVGVQL